MTDETTNPVDGDAMPEVVDAAEGEREDLIQAQEGEGNQETDETEGGEQEAASDLIDVEYEGETFKVPPVLKDALLRQSDYTKKTQDVAAERKAVADTKAQLEQAQARQLEFAGDIARYGALDDKLQPYLQVQDWGAHIRQHGVQGQADFADYQALKAERDQFAAALGQKVQQRQIEEQRETAKLIEEGRAELAKHIPGYSDATLSKLVDAGTQYGFSSDEIRQAETDPRSLRVLHDASQWREHLARTKKTASIAQAQKTTPVQTLRGAGGRIVARPDTDDFTAFERLADEKARAKG